MLGWGVLRQGSRVSPPGAALSDPGRRIGNLREDRHRLPGRESQGIRGVDVTDGVPDRTSIGSAPRRAPGGSRGGTGSSSTRVDWTIADYKRPRVLAMSVAG